MTTKRYVEPPKDDNGWGIRLDGHHRALEHAPTRGEAVELATRLASEDGGGHVYVMNEVGKYTERLAIAPAPAFAPRRGH